MINIHYFLNLTKTFLKNSRDMIIIHYQYVKGSN